MALSLFLSSNAAWRGTAVAFLTLPFSRYLAHFCHSNRFHQSLYLSLKSNAKSILCHRRTAARGKCHFRRQHSSNIQLAARNKERDGEWDREEEDEWNQVRICASYEKNLARAAATESLSQKRGKDTNQLMDTHTHMRAVRATCQKLRVERVQERVSECASESVKQS